MNSKRIFLILFLIIPALVFVLGGVWFFKSYKARKAAQEQRP